MAHQVLAPMAGTVFRVDCVVGAEVNDETVMVMMESMKMEVPVEAGASGIVRKVLCAEGDVVEHDQVLVEIE